ncbi:hypothetical protein BIW11_08691 [Tropilaelaps mercedesae]|uniref:Uncharacterized protein n=1 Tax=Tropilaelaps mercedesae TaxID=418985 RepID=A0A1V9XNF2_9ACAR|nr:hypothetical protein BIW11_08691 [Tropilaelaps mercedesae]
MVLLLCCSRARNESRCLYETHAHTLWVFSLHLSGRAIRPQAHTTACHYEFRMFVFVLPLQLRCNEPERSMPGQVMPPTDVAWDQQKQEDYRDLMDSGNELEVVTDDDVVPVDFSRVSQDLLRLVRRTYHLYTAYRIMEPPRFRSRSDKRWRSRSPPLRVAQRDEDHSDIETYAERLKKMCNASNFDDEDEETDGPIVSETSESDGGLYGTGLGTIDALEPNDRVIELAPKGEEDVFAGGQGRDLVEQESAIFEGFMKDLSNVGCFEERYECEKIDAYASGKDAFSTAELASVLEAEDLPLKDYAATVTSARPHRDQDPGIAAGEQQLRPKSPFTGELLPETPDVDGRNSSTPPRLPPPPPPSPNERTTTKATSRKGCSQNDSGDSVQRRSIRRLRYSRTLADRTLAATGDEASSPPLTRRELAKRKATLARTHVDASAKPTCRESFVVLERLEDIIVTKQGGDEPTQETVRAEGHNQNESSDGRGDDNENDNDWSDGDSSERRSADDQPDGDNSLPADVKPSVDALSRLGASDPEIGGRPEPTRVSATERVSEDLSPVTDSPAETKRLDASDLETQPESGGVVSSDDDGDPRSFADLFNNSSASRVESDVQRAIPSGPLASSIASTLLSVASAILSARRRAESFSPPSRRSGRVVSRDSGFAESEDSRGSVIDSDNRLDEYWVRRRRYWEMTDIRDEVHELLGFLPAASPPRAVAAAHVATPSPASAVSAGAKRKPTKATIKRTLAECKPPAKRPRRAGGGGGGATTTATSTTAPLAADERNAWQSKESLKVTVSKRSGRSIRPPEHMDI